MRKKGTFSLQNLFVWCSLAAILLAVLGLGFRGVQWAEGASWGMLFILTLILVQTVIYWILYLVALALEFRREKKPGVYSHPMNPSLVPPLSSPSGPSPIPYPGNPPVELVEQNGQPSSEDTAP